MAGVQEIRQRIAQQGVVRLEVLEQGFLVPDRLRQVGDVPADGVVEFLGGRFVPRLQIIQGIVQPVHRLAQRIIMGQQAGTCQQHVAVQFGVVHLEGVQRLVHAFPQAGVRILATQ